ncbi:MAG: porin [Pseudomonadota bacterium]
MTFIRWALAAACFGLAAGSSAAGDLPVIVEPAENLDLCAAYGEGYIAIPDTDTCIRISAGVQTDFNAYVDLGGSSNRGISNGGRSESDFRTRMRSRGRVQAQSVTETPFGPLNTYVDMSLPNGFGTNR